MRQENRTRSLNLHSTELLTQDFTPGGVRRGSKCNATDATWPVFI